MDFSVVSEFEHLIKLPTTTTTTTSQQVMNNWSLEDYAYIRKCGEITVSTNDDECFWLNCMFCPGICLQFDVFVQHIREAHGHDIKTLDDDANNNANLNATSTTATTNLSDFEFNFDELDELVTAHERDDELDRGMDDGGVVVVARTRTLGQGQLTGCGGTNIDVVDMNVPKGLKTEQPTQTRMRTHVDMPEMTTATTTTTTILTSTTPLPPPPPPSDKTEYYYERAMARTTIKTLRTRSIVSLSLDSNDKDNANDNNKNNMNNDCNDYGNGKWVPPPLPLPLPQDIMNKERKELLLHQFDSNCVNANVECHGDGDGVSGDGDDDDDGGNGVGQRQRTHSTTASVFIDKQVNNPHNTRARGKAIAQTMPDNNNLYTNNTNTSTNTNSTNTTTNAANATKLTMKSVQSEFDPNKRRQKRKQQEKQQQQLQQQQQHQLQSEPQPKRGRHGKIERVQAQHEDTKAMPIRTTTRRTPTPTPTPPPTPPLTIAVDYVYIVEAGDALQGDLQLMPGVEETTQPFGHTAMTDATAVAAIDGDNNHYHRIALDCAAEDVQTMQQGKDALTAVMNVTESNTKEFSESEEMILKTPTRREVLRDKEIITYLLEAYKNNEKLWNPKHPEYKYNAQRNIFNELSEPLLRDMNCNLSGLEIFAILKELKCRYRQELAKCSNTGGIGGSDGGGGGGGDGSGSCAIDSGRKSRLWYFEKFEFLRHLIEHKRAERVAKLRCEHVKGKPLESNHVLLQILTAYRRREELWNPGHLAYNTCNKDEVYTEIAQQLFHDLNATVSGKECESTILKLQQRYRAELTRLLRCKGLYLPKLWCFDDMEFLRAVEERAIDKRLCKERSLLHTKPKKSYRKVEAITFATTDDQCHFIDIYRNYKALWQVDHTDYRSATYRASALNSMLNDVNDTFDIKATLDELQKTIYQMRKDYSSEKKKKLLNNEIMPNAIYSKLAEFLDVNIGPFRCDVCATIIKTCDQYKIHKSKHDGTTPFTCTLCGRGFQIQGNLTIHIRRHKRDFPYACGVCEKRFATSTEVTIHMRTHTGERPYICDLCGKSFKTYSFFDLHQRIHRQESNFHCPVCVRDFYEKNRFTDHMNRHFNIRKHTCPVCKKSFTTAANLRKHSEVHALVKKYKCDQCDVRYAQAASLRWHKATVHGKKAKAKFHEQ